LPNVTDSEVANGGARDAALGGNDGGSFSGVTVLLRTRGGTWSEPTTEAWTDEKTLEELILGAPTLLPGVTDPGTVAVNQFWVLGTGQADIVSVTPVGAITICEVKLKRNSDIRRTVVGQVLAYAAGLQAMDFESFDAAWRARAKMSVLQHLLGSDADSSGAEELRSAITENLQLGRFRLVLAVDQLTDELRSIITYLSTHTTPDVDVVGLEIAFATRDGFEVAIPRTWGLELNAARSTSGRRSGTNASVDVVRPILVAAADLAVPGGGSVVGRILDGLQSLVAHAYLGRDGSPDAILVVHDPVESQPVRFHLTNSVPGVRVCFDWMSNLDRPVVSDLLEGLESDDCLRPHLAGVREKDFRKRPIIPLADLVNHPAAADVLVSELTKALAPTDPQ
jgi:hypothetical protein